MEGQKFTAIGPPFWHAVLAQAPTVLRPQQLLTLGVLKHLQTKGLVPFECGFTKKELLTDCQLPQPDVAGSTPVSRSIFSIAYKEFGYPLYLH